MRDDTPCPSSGDLEAVFHGGGSTWDVEQLSLHLETCSRCAEAAEAVLDRSAFAEVLREPPAKPDAPDADAVRRLVGHLLQLLPGPSGLVGSKETPLAPDTVSPADRISEVCDLLGPPQDAGEIGRIGDYPVFQVLGIGGMGAVFQARQARPQRVVALKIIRAGAGRQRLARFRAEAEVVARLQHPNIVQIYDVGKHGGLPFFTMEFVGGGNLAQRLARSPLAAAAAAELVEALARAAHFAHAHGVIHRDLKPSNVLLQRTEDRRKRTENTGQGTEEREAAESVLCPLSSVLYPKITDFGLAKCLADEAAPAGGYRTESGAILGTPGYMAPEQATGRESGPAADVHALGAILYEALTGRPPFRAATVLETLEQVRSHEPVPPGHVQPGLPPDLQNICLKCLEKEPGRRYGSALELAEDLRRFRAGEPVRARPVGAGERLQKWVRRKPAAAALLAVSVASALAFATGIVLHNTRLRAALGRAEAQEAEARTQHALAAGNYRAARAALNRMLERLEDPRLADVPRLKELRQQLLEDSLAFCQEIIARQDDPDPEVRLDTAFACRSAADIQMSLQRPAAAADNYRRAVRLLSELPDEHRTAPRTQMALAGCYNNLAMMVQGRGPPEEVERYHRAALDIRERVAREHPAEPDWQNDLAETEHNLGVMYQLQGQFTDAEPHYARAVAVRTALVRNHPRVDPYQRKLAESQLNLALVYQSTNRPAEAIKANRQAEDALRPLAARHPEEPGYALSLAGVCVNWGNLLRNGGQLQEALARHTRAVELADAALRQEPRLHTARERAYEAHGTRAQTYELLGRFADAVNDWDRVLELDEPAGRWVRRALRALDLARAGDHARAAAEAQALEGDPEVTADGRYNLACAYALAVGQARADNRLAAAERAALAERYAARAIAVLHKLGTGGYFEHAEQSKMLTTDPDLEPLRGRDDFRRLLSGASRPQDE